MSFTRDIAAERNALKKKKIRCPSAFACVVYIYVLVYLLTIVKPPKYADVYYIHYAAAETLKAFAH